MFGQSSSQKPNPGRSWRANCKELFKPMIKISVITVCFNAAPYIEMTLRSVLEQDYPNLEFIVIDGASTDGTQKIIEKYRDRINHYVSEPDGGQYAAIQKGLSLATGDVMCWLNADDTHMPWTYSVVGDIFNDHPNVEWITGLPAFLNRRGQMTAIYGAVGSYPQHFIANGWFNRNLGGFLQQESMFWRRSLWDKTSGLDLNMHYAADYALWLQLARHAQLVPVSVPLAAFRRLPGEQRSSLGSDKYDDEVTKLVGQLKTPPLLWRWASRGGVVLRSLARLVIRHRAPAILYDETTERWRVVTTRRAIVRVGTRELALMFSLRRGNGT